jgi:hypothetical protein
METKMKKTLKTLMMFSSLAYSFEALCHDEKDGKDTASHETHHEKTAVKEKMSDMKGKMDMEGMMLKCKKMHQDMEDMMKNMSDPKMKEQMQRMHDEMGKMMEQMQSMRGMMGDNSGMGPMSADKMKGMNMTDMKRDADKDKK